MSYPSVAFRPSEKNHNRVAWAKTIGLDVAVLMNELMDEHFDAIAKKKAQKTLKEVERAKGFEPSTFTLAR